MRKYLFNLFFICALAFYLIGCGSTEKPQVPTLPALASSQTLNITFIDEYTGKAVWGENITSAEAIFGFTNQEETLRSNCQSGAIGGFVISSGILNVWYSGTNTANRRRPNIGLRTGEEPMMNMVTDALLYYARKNYTKTTGNINIRVAVHNGGGINGPISNINPTSFRNGDALDFFKSKFFRFDNYLAVVELTPLEIKNLLEYGVAQMWYQNGENTLSGNAGVSDGNFLHCSGLNFTYTRGASAADNNAYFYNATDKQIKNYGSRIIDVWLWNIPQYDEINDKYDTGLYQKLHNPSADSIQIIKNGEVVAAYKDMKIGVVTVNFLLYGDESCKTALGLSGPNDSKIKFVDSANRPNEALVSILADGNYYLYHRLQGRIVVKETGGGSQSNVSGSVLLAIGSTQLSNYIVAGSNPKTDTSLTSTLTFTLVDPDLNRFSYQQEIYDTTWNILRIYNASRQPSTEIELIALTEGGQNSKGFTGTVKTSNDVDSTFAANNGVLIGKDGDEVRIVYQDPFNSTDRLELRKTLIEGTLASNNFREDVKSITLSNVTSSGDVDTGNITTFSWSSSGFFTLTIVDTDANDSSAILQSCTAILEVYRNNALADREIITLYEANVNSSNFTVNTIGSVDYIGANVINNGKIDVLNGDTIIIKYNTKYDTSTPNYYQKSYRVTLTPTIISFNIERGTYLFNLTDNCYSGDTLWVIITDTDQNMSSTTNETLQVILTIVKSTTGDLAYDTVVLTCTEGIASAGGVSISNNASTFVGWLNIEDAAAFTTSDNKLQVPYTTEILNKKALYYYQIRLYYKDPDSVEELVDYLPFK